MKQVFNMFSTLYITLFSVYGLFLFIFLVGTDITPIFTIKRLVIWIILGGLMLISNIRKHITNKYED